jgi:hypothetical protein
VAAWSVNPGTSARNSPPKDRWPPTPGRDAATVSGRLGTTLINIYGEDAP